MKRLLVALLVFAVLVPMASSVDGKKKKKLPLFQPTCDVPVTISFRLENDLDCSAALNGIVVGADKITIDLNGKRVFGNLVGDGIRNADGFDGVTVKNGEVRGFQDGFFGDGADRNRIFSVIFSQNDNDGVEFQGAGSTGQVVRGVTVTNNGDEGIEFNDGITKASIIGVVAIANATTGILLSINAGKVSGNRVTSTPGNGIIVDGNNNTVSGNRSDGNGVNGIFIDGDSNGLKKNVTFGNDINGILIDGAGNVLNKNHADSNGYDVGNSDGVGLGIDASLDLTVKGKKNKAHGNDNPLECAGISCS